MIKRWAIHLKGLHTESSFCSDSTAVGLGRGGSSSLSKSTHRMESMIEILGYSGKGWFSEALKMFCLTTLTWRIHTDMVIVDRVVIATWYGSTADRLPLGRFSNLPSLLCCKLWTISYVDFKWGWCCLSPSDLWLDVLSAGKQKLIRWLCQWYYCNRFGLEFPTAIDIALRPCNPCPWCIGMKYRQRRRSFIRWQSWW